MLLGRGTTPEFKFKSRKMDISTLKNIYITFKQEERRLEITKTGDDVKIDIENQTISCKLTQEETLKFDDRYTAECQVRASTYTGEKVRSKPRTLQVGRILKDGVIE